MVKGFGVCVFLAVAASSMATPAGAAPPRCTYSISPSNARVGAGETSGTFAVITTSGCAWTATSASAFLTVTSNSSGTGSGTVSYRAAANTATTSRSGAISVAKKNFTVTQAAAPAPANQPPTADAGAPQTVTGGSLVTLNGSGTDPEGRPITYRWRQTQGPIVTLSNATAPSPSFTAPSATSVSQALTFELVVNDGTLDSAPSSVTITVAALPAPPPPPAPALDPAYSTVDIGSVGVLGSATSADGVFTVSGAGADIWGTADSFRFVYQPLAGDGEVVARMVSMGNTNAYAKAGVMLRGGLAAGAEHVLLSMKPNGEVEFMTRSAANGSTTWLAGLASGAPAYLKLARVGSTIGGYVSKDGVTWTKVGSVAASLPSSIYPGLVVCSHDTATLNTSTFDAVRVTATAPNLAPIASAGADQAAQGGSTVTLNGSGSDPEGQPLSYAWTQVRGLAVALSNASIPAPTFVAPAATNVSQSLAFRLVVNDGVQDSSPSTVTVTIPAVAGDPNTAASLLPPPPVGGATIQVPAGANLQAAINAALPGDVVVLAAGATYTGTFYLPAKGGSAYVMIRSSASFQEGSRVTPTTTGLARIVSPTQEPAMVTQPGASFYWLEGLELATAGGPNDILRLGDGSPAQNRLDQVPHDLVVSHCYIHGRTGVEQKRGIALNSGLTYVADSHVDEIKGVAYDTQAIGGWNGPGPYRIYNNHLSAAGEVFMLGGADPAIQNLVPTDVVFKGNLLTRPTSWRGTSWCVKNVFELKNARQVLVDGNVFENHWQADQPGPAIVFTPRNQDGRAPWTVVRDVNFVNNRVRHVAAVFNILAYDNVNPSQLTQNILIANNVFEDVSSTNWGGSGRLLLINGGDNVRLEHNTVFQNGSSFIYAYGSQATNFSFTSNIAPHGEYGIIGDGAGAVSGTLAAYFPAHLVSGNLIVGNYTAYPAGNAFPATMAEVGFVNLGAGDYRLASTSLYRNTGADGADPGADMTRIPQ